MANTPLFWLLFIVLVIGLLLLDLLVLNRKAHEIKLREALGFRYDPEELDEMFGTSA